MKSRIIATAFAAVAASLLLCAAGAVRADSMSGMHMNKPAAAAKKGLIVKCAVSRETIGAPSAAYASETYKGKIYYFCCPKCKPQFDANRSKYIKNGYPAPTAKKKAAPMRKAVKNKA